MLVKIFVMKNFVILLAICCVILVLSEASKSKKEWRQKKYSKKLGHHHGHNGMGKKAYRMEGGHHHGHHKMKGKHHKRGKVSHKKHLAWLKVKSAADCGLQCGHGEVCISGPVDTKPLCVRKKDLKKSMKLFHRYQKKEMKAWRKFQRENYSGIKDHEYYKFDSSMADMKKKHLDKHGYSHHLDLHKGKHMKKPHVPGLVGKEECTTSEFSQMRTRMMGWFHLLHGQDHLAKKQAGNIKHFHKHVSVKKELREHDGNRCECFKSAMWQFNQMDKNGDDHLNEFEMSVMEENSMEPCMRPYLTSCDRNADGKLSSDEWCCCFANVVAPCFKKLDEIRRSGKPVTYMPRCDKEGYYMREQCMGETKDAFKCWCVDYNGNPYKGTEKEGRAHCSKMALQMYEDGRNV